MLGCRSIFKRNVAGRRGGVGTALAVVSALAITLGPGSSSADAAPAPAPAPTPGPGNSRLYNPTTHTECLITTYPPEKRGNGIVGLVNIECTPNAPDLAEVTVTIWRYDRAMGQYFQVGQKRSYDSYTEWSVTASGPCTANVSYDMHVEGEVSMSDDGWNAHDLGNSGAVPLEC